MNLSVAVCRLFFILTISIFVFVVVPRWLWPASDVSQPVELVVISSDQTHGAVPRRLAVDGGIPWQQRSNSKQQYPLRSNGIGASWTKTPHYFMRHNPAGRKNPRANIHRSVMNEMVYPDSHLLQVNMFNLSFFVSAKHHQWVQKNEKGCLAVVNHALTPRKGNCTTYDIGMNDGFFTQLFSAYGCCTWSFELHPTCINISQKALKRNGFSHLVNISHLAISDSNKIVTAPKSPNCDGSLSISRKSSQVSLTSLS